MKDPEVQREKIPQLSDRDAWNISAREKDITLSKILRRYFLLQRCHGTVFASPKDQIFFFFIKTMEASFRHRKKKYNCNCLFYNSEFFHAILFLYLIIQTCKDSCWILFYLKYMILKKKIISHNSQNCKKSGLQDKKSELWDINSLYKDVNFFNSVVKMDLHIIFFIVDWKDSVDGMEFWSFFKLSKIRAFIFKHVEKWRRYLSFHPRLQFPLCNHSMAVQEGFYVSIWSLSNEKWS